MNEEQQKKNIICHCVQVSEYTIRKSIQKGNRTLEELKKSLHVASTCKFCFVDIVKIMKEEGVIDSVSANSKQQTVKKNNK